MKVASPTALFLAVWFLLWIPAGVWLGAMLAVRVVCRSRR